MSNSSELDQKVKCYILANIDLGCVGAQTKITADVIAALERTFLDEYGWAVARMGEQKALREWLQGLPSAVHIAFYNHDILKLAIKWGSLPENPTEKQEDRILENYWDFMANKIGQLFRGYRVPKGVIAQ